MKNLLALGAIAAISIQSLYTGYDSLCVSDIGTRAFMTGEPSIVGSVCSKYDYAQFFPKSMQQKVASLSK